MSKAVHAAGIERIELERLRVRVGRLFDALQEAVEDVASPVPGAWLPPVDLCESGETVTVRVELPGIRIEHIEIALTNAQLRISGKKKKGAPRGRIAHLCSERSYGHFSRSVPLRWAISVRDASARLHNGVLTIQLPKLKDRRGAEFRVPIEEIDEP